MNQNYFIVTLAHSLHGKLQRIHIPHRIVYASLCAFGVMMLMMMSVAGSYARMALKVANYNSLQHEAQMLRQRYDNLQIKVKQTNEQLFGVTKPSAAVAAATPPLNGFVASFSSSRKAAGDAPFSRS